MLLLRSTLNDILDDADLEFQSVYVDYSGRGMYGDKCFGIIGNLHTYAVFLIAATAILNTEEYGWGGELLEALANPRVDSLGRESIYYFPSLEIGEGDETPTNLKSSPNPVHGTGGDF